MNNEHVRIFADKDSIKRHFETALQIDKERQSVILQSIGDAVIATDMDGSIILMNSVAEKLTGWKSGEADSKPIAEVFHIVNKITREISNNPIKSVLETGKEQKLDPNTVLISRNNYDEYSVSDSCAPIFDTKGNIMGVVLVFRDISKQKQDEALKENITRDLIHRNNEHVHFNSIISHDLKGPVANIISLSRIVNDKDLDESEKETITTALLTSAEKLNEVLDDLNLILNSEKQLSDKKEDVHFSKIVSDIQTSLNNILKKEQVNFNLDFNKVDIIFTIKSYIYSVFYNLISNSIKYRISNIPLDITISSDLVDKKVILKFKDNGLGIDLMKYKDDLFGLYKRFHYGKAKGKGMGLYMVKSQVEKLGGKIYVQSKVNQGTEFTIELER
ncbi:PAS domain-containing protein [Algoriphagus lutimaris]|uniref:sensor histidine kinase n=1 Tax=Algoriphagus lutimaris TaxID=613197 RepID=UPI00196AE959|nr:HAMP domain-containing sensor histidine kinase [Algoriphagus lutimaris]MBN3519328.1 PAS domain-containing protein [Algoriphagus lutimaris]